MKVEPLPEGGAVIVDELGSIALEMLPAAEVGVLLELGGTLNRGEERWSGKFLFSPGQAGELLADVMVSMVKTGGEPMVLLKAALVEAVRRQGLDDPEELTELAFERAARRGEPTVVQMGDQDDESLGEAHVFPPFPNPDFDGDAFCRVVFAGGGPLDGKECNVPVAVACAGMALGSQGDIDIGKHHHEGGPDGG